MGVIWTRADPEDEVRNLPRIPAPQIAFEGSEKAGINRTRNRIVMTMLVFLAIFGAISGRLVFFGMKHGDIGSTPFIGGPQLASRPDIVDRNGEILATDIKTASLYAEPKRIIDPDEAIELLSTVIPDLDWEQTYRRLTSGLGFVWLKRDLSPKQESEILGLGIPGIGFRTEKRRFYPGGPVASHVIGLVNIDNQGISGLEKYIDGQGLSVLQKNGMADDGPLAPVKLSLDLRVQHIVRDEVAQAMTRFQAIAAGGVVLNVKTGEVLAMVSLPDFDPNNPVDALDKNRLNRMSGGVFEMGSTFKSFTLAMGLDEGKITFDSTFDATKPLRIDGFAIHDFEPQHHPLTVPEIFKYSSNIGAAEIALKVGLDAQKAFLTKMGLLSRMQTELPEVAEPTQPAVWKKINGITIAFGHGVATTPLQTAVAGAALMNGGLLIEPTFFPRSQAQADAVAKRVVKPETSREMRYLFQLNALEGSGRNALVPGYNVGGKTGTAEKVVDGRYSSAKRFNAFLGAFPMDDPQYVVLVVLDEPKALPGQYYATAGMNAAPTVGNIIRRSGALLGVKPEFGQDGKPLLVTY
jgi:cell division protein FtsI (penicillin-binding protein 3)